MTSMKLAFDNASTLTAPTLSTDSTTTTKESTSMTTLTIDQQIRNVKAHELKPELQRIRNNAKRRGATDVWKSADTWLSTVDAMDISELNLDIMQAFIKDNQPKAKVAKPKASKPKRSKTSKPATKAIKPKAKVAKPKASKPKRSKASKPAPKPAPKRAYKPDAVSTAAKAVGIKYGEMQRVFRALYRGETPAQACKRVGVSPDKIVNVKAVKAGKAYYFAKRDSK